MNLRKKLTTSIVTQIITALAGIMAAFGLDVPPDVQAAIGVLTLFIMAMIQGSYNIGQGIADKGKEAGKTLLIFFLCGGLMSIGLPAYSQDGPESEPTISCCADYDACEELLDECNDCAPCPECLAEECESTIKEVLLDKKLRAGIILILAGVVGAVIPLFITPN